MNKGNEGFTNYTQFWGVLLDLLFRRSQKNADSSAPLAPLYLLSFSSLPLPPLHGNWQSLVLKYF